MNARMKRAVSYTPVDAAMRKTSTEDALAIMDAMRDCGIKTIASGRCYLLVAVHGPRTISEVARSLGLPMSTASRLLWELHQLGLIAYSAGRDRRIKQVQLS